MTQQQQTDILEFANDIANYGEYREPIDISSNALLRAILGGHTAVPNFLLTSNQPSNIWNLYEALEKATVKGLHIVADQVCEAFLDCNCGSKMEDVFVFLAGKGYVNALKYSYDRGYDNPDLFDHGLSGSTMIGDAVVRAARSGHINAVEFLLNTRRVSSNAFDKSFEVAAEFGRNMVVAFLHKKKHASSQTLLKKQGTLPFPSSCTRSSRFLLNLW